MQRPGRARLIGDLLEAGFSAVLARELAEACPRTKPRRAHRLLHAGAGPALPAMNCDADIIDRGGVFALVGPTGVGKTTTTAKLAARCVVRHGADKLALITTDGYRIGAHEHCASTAASSACRCMWCATPPTCAKPSPACATSTWC